MPPESNEATVQTQTESTTNAIPNVNTTVHDNSVRSSVQPFDTAETTQPKFKFEDIVPGDFRQKPYMNEVKDFDSMFKRFDEMQSLIGKKYLPPGEGATDAEKESFYKQWGRPDKAEDYKYPELGEGVEVNEDAANAFKKICHEAGMNQKQFETVISKYNEHVKSFQESQALAMDEDFDKRSVDLFEAEKDDVIKFTRDMIDKYCPESMKGLTGNLSNDALFVLAGTLKNFYKQYGTEDGLVERGATQSFDVNAAKKRAIEIMSSKEYSDPMHPDNERLKKEVADIYKSIPEKFL